MPVAAPPFLIESRAAPVFFLVQCRPACAVRLMFAGLQVQFFRCRFSVVCLLFFSNCTYLKKTGKVEHWKICTPYGARQFVMNGHCSVCLCFINHVCCTNAHCRNTKLFCRATNLFCKTTNLFCRTSDRVCRTTNRFCRTSDRVCRTTNMFCRTSDRVCRTTNRFCRTSDRVCRTTNLFCRDSDRVCRTTKILFSNFVCSIVLPLYISN